MSWKKNTWIIEQQTLECPGVSWNIEQQPLNIDKRIQASDSLDSALRRLTVSTRPVHVPVYPCHPGSSGWGLVAGLSLK